MSESTSRAPSKRTRSKKITSILPQLAVAAPTLTPRSTGGTAAQEVYSTIELRARILKLLDRPTLASFLRVEKAATTSVAEVLYREVHTSKMGTMSRASIRRSAYCDAVRVLDLSPHPRIAFLYDSRRPDPERAKPTRFDPQTLLVNLNTWRKKCPNLRKILYHYPANGEDDAFVVHIRHDNIFVELESHAQLEFYSLPFTPPTLPPTPVINGMTFRHTIAIQLVSDTITLPYPRFGSDEAEKQHRQRWKQWLFNNDQLDRRVTSIDIETFFRGTINVTYDDHIHFLSLRKLHNCEPVAKFFFNQYGNHASLDEIREISDALGPELRVLHCSGHLSIGGRHQPVDEYQLQTAIILLDRAHPSLHELRLSYYPADSRLDFSGTSVTLSGLESLRKFILSHGYMKFKTSKEKVAQWLRGIGGETCVFQSMTFDTLERMGEFNALVRDGVP